jgi:hypothetical protein
MNRVFLTYDLGVVSFFPNDSGVPRLTGVCRLNDLTVESGDVDFQLDLLYITLLVQGNGLFQLPIRMTAK